MGLAHSTSMNSKENTEGKKGRWQSNVLIVRPATASPIGSDRSFGRMAGDVMIFSAHPGILLVTGTASD